MTMPCDIVNNVTICYAEKSPSIESDCTHRIAALSVGQPSPD